MKEVVEFDGYFRWYCSCGVVGGKRHSRLSAEVGFETHVEETSGQG